MRKAERKLKLSDNVIGDDNLDNEGSHVGGTEAGDLKSVIFGLHVFDPMEMNIENPGNQLDMGELTGLAEKVVASRQGLQADVGNRKFEINPLNQMNGKIIMLQEGSELISFNAGLDEASYVSWVENFKQALPADDSDVLDLGHRRTSPDGKHLRAEAARKKAEEKKLSKWQARGYHSLSVSMPVDPDNQDLMSDFGSVHFVYGDCTSPATVCPSESAIIFR